MVKSYYSKIHFTTKTIKIILTLVIIYCVIFKNNVIFAEELEMSDKEAIINLRQLVHDRLLRF